MGEQRIGPTAHRESFFSYVIEAEKLEAPPPPPRPLQSSDRAIALTGPDKAHRAADAHQGSGRGCRGTEEGELDHEGACSEVEERTQGD